ncbi:MAG: DUF11 domain-containing protein, partial [Gammaproteobacteria bacterium]|nr:DUF11 domain-containing protein [Gammaproteobacteria bacterium]
MSALTLSDIKHRLIVIAMGCLLCFSQLAQADGPTCPAALHSANAISHDLSVSFCELCDIGTVRLVVENPFRASDDADFSNIVVTEDLLASGLTYVPGSTSFSTTNVAAPPVVEPVVSGANGSVLTWTLDAGFVMDGSPSGNPGTRPRLEITFNVQRHASLTEEGLVGAVRNIEGSVLFDPSCAPTFPHTLDTGIDVLPLEEPEPEIIKMGRNVDAGQGSGSYSDPVYGHENDDAIWRIEVRNNGLADLQDLRFDESMAPGNFTISHVCDNEADADSVATGGAAGGCVALGGVTDVLNFSVEQAFGGGPGPYIAAPAGGSGFYYFVGTLTNSCLNRTNTILDVEWGCQVEAPPGGIAATSAGLIAGDTAELSTLAVANNLDVDVFLTGTNESQPMGAKGTVRIRIRNFTGGTIKGGVGGLRIRDLLPPQYVIDPTYTPTIAVSPAYGNSYPGMLDEVTWTNPQPNTFPLTSIDPADPLSNTDLNFVVTSSTVHPVYADQYNMLRHGDVINIRFRTVQIDPTYYDKEAYLDVREEEPASTPPGTDPTESFAIDNQVEVWFEEFCTATEHHLTFNDSDQAEPEDLDIDVVGNAITFILTNTDALDLSVNLRNNGGHDADDYFAYVTFGEAMSIQTAPAGCSIITNPPPMPIWTDPVILPASASVYQCDRGVISPNETETLTFQVVKNPDINADDDLTFRADVIGEITLDDGTPLWFPAPTPRGDGVLDRANNYTIDTVRARVVGYNLLKNQLGVCTENNPPPGSPDTDVQIGEECSVAIESGGWFGFQTPGFTYIAVENIEVVDELPNGQGYISSTDPFAPGMSTTQIKGVSLNPPPVPLSDAWFDWTFNIVDRITERDHWFRVNATTRLLNDPIDTRAPPNVHAALSRNVLNSTFDAIFFNPLTSSEELYSLGPSTVGFPPEFRRRVDLTVTEPNIIITKEVCNETLYGVGPSCSNFVPLADDGDAYDTYIWRVTVANEASASGVARAPAYDLTVTSLTDPADLAFIDPLDSDGLDNDGDGLIDEALEGLITPDNIVKNGFPAEIITTFTDSDALLRIDAGDSVVMYYRIDPDDDVAPLQQLNHSASAEYDSLENASGAQTAPQGANGEAGGARQYVSAPGPATVQIIPVQVIPKQITQLSNTAPVVGLGPQPVSIGEELEFELRTSIPVAQLRSFEVRDELPAGLSCVYAPDINLDAPPYDAGGFMPGGTFTPTCTDTEVVWSFGDQTVTQAPGGATRFDFDIQFLARVDNVVASQDGLVITNGGAATVTTISYIDQIGNPVTIDFGAAQVVISEPVLDLVKTFAVPSVDAGDVVTVTVSATNNGTATAYNPRLLDDLSGVYLDYVGNVTGADPPNVDTTTFGADQPLFSWAPGFAIAPTETVEFTFDVSVPVPVQPEQILPNTIQSDWTSLPSQSTALNPTGLIGVDGDPDGMRIGALPNAADPLNDYESEASADVTVYAPVVAKADLDPAQLPEIGSHRQFQVEITLPEGTNEGVRLADDLNAGVVSHVLARNVDFDVVYDFVGIDTINGQVPSEAAFNAVPVDGASGTIEWNVGTVVTDIEDDLGTPVLTPAIRITYFARINNDLVTDVGDTLQNSADLYYLHGETAVEQLLNAAAGPVVAIESDLTATMTLTNVTLGKAAADPLDLDDIAEYVITVVNGGNATAYDVNIVDTLPVELTLHDSYTPTATINATPVVGFVETPAGANDGPLIWGRDNGDGSFDLAPGAFLELTYQARMRVPAENNNPLTNTAWIDWTSLQSGSAYERTGNGCPTTAAPDDYCYGPVTANGTPVPIAPPEALYKANTQATAGIGESFRYSITVPSVPYGIPLYDVRILDDLGASAAELIYVDVQKVTGSGSWSAANTGTATNLVLEDAVGGIDIPAGEQVVVDITVYLDDTPTNVDGLSFTNSAYYTYNRFDDNPASVRTAAAGTTQPMTVGEPELTLEKTGPAQMRLGIPGAFTLDLHNITTVSAWATTIYDVLPDDALAGMCDAAPGQFTAQVFEADGATPVSGLLAEGADFSTSFDVAPDCRLTVSMLTPAGAIGPDERLIVTYEASLDLDSEHGETLTNIAAASEWFSADVADAATADRARAYARPLTDGTPGVLDHEDEYTVLVNLPKVLFEKTAVNVTSGEDPATVATPGETLRYSLRVENVGDVALNDFSVVDDLDRLNALPAFAGGTLSIVSAPAGADTSFTDPVGGSKGTGLLDVRGMDVGVGESVQLYFDVVLAPVIANGSYVTNQSQLSNLGLPVADSDDPNVNGAADPNVVGDEDPTQILIESAPAFDVDKISTYVDGDPNVLMAGETLRYTITVQNIGTDHATDATIIDQIPANTTYVAGSTTLNGVAVPDGAGGLSPLANALPINSPADSSDGYMSADVTATPSNVAVIEFDVDVYPDLLDGTVLSNQAYVSAVTGGVVDQPSDDPRTAVVDDPTRDVVGNLPLIFADKAAALEQDYNSPGVVDPGDVLRYTIRVYNNGAIDASDVVLMDGVPANTTYVAGTLTLNGEPAYQPDGGVFPLENGIPISSSDLTPPLPNAGEGTLTSGDVAIVQFDLRVDDGVATGTLITNQAVVTSEELPNVLTDGDGDPATGPEPTVVVVGPAQQLAITKQVAVVGGGPAVAGSTLEYVVRVRNVGVLPALDVRITDDLDFPFPNYLAYVDQSATLNGAASGVVVSGQQLSVDYGDLEAGAAIILRFQAVMNANLAIGTTVTNRAVAYWNTTQQAFAEVSIDVGGVVGVGILNGALWHDASYDNQLDPNERALEGWTVELHRNDKLVHATVAAADGTYQINGLAPNYQSGDTLALVFKAPGAGANTALLGEAYSADFTTGLQQIYDIIIQPGNNLLNLDLPIDPNGVVYDSVSRAPVAGVTLTLVRAASGVPVPADCFDDTAQQNQVTRSDGYY